MEREYRLKSGSESVRVIDDVVSIQCLSIDWLKRCDVMPSRSE